MEDHKHCKDITYNQITEKGKEIHRESQSIQESIRKDLLRSMVEDEDRQSKINNVLQIQKTGSRCRSISCRSSVFWNKIIKQCQSFLKMSQKIYNISTVKAVLLSVCNG